MSFNYEKRGAGYPNIRIVNKPNPIEIPTAVMQEKYGIKLFIRIPQFEYPEDAAPSIKIVHFGLPIQDEKVGDTLALTRIIQNGSYVPGLFEEPPLLSLENIWTGRLIKVAEMVPFEKIPPECFAHTIGNIRDLNELKERILSRYRHSLSTLGDNQILSYGVSIREMILGERLKV